jgi:hypothetical protein
MKALGVTVKTTQEQGELEMHPGCGNVELFVKGQPKNIQLRIQTDAQSGVTPIAIQGGQPHEYDDGAVDFILNVPVTWVERGAKQVPRTRQRDVDNVDILFVEPMLQFRDIQVALVTRGERFFVTIQRVYQGIMRIENEEVRFIPSDPTHAYPGMDYAQTWQNMGHVLSLMTRIVHETIQSLGGEALEIPNPSEWAPKVIPEVTGWQQGWVEFFNPITNNGRILGSDGNEYFVGANALAEVKGPVKLLSPMKGVYFRVGNQEEGQRYAPIKSVKLPTTTDRNFKG